MMNILNVTGQPIKFKVDKMKVILKGHESIDVQEVTDEMRAIPNLIISDKTQSKARNKTTQKS